MFVVETPLFPSIDDRLAPVYHTGLIFHGVEKHEILTVDFAAKPSPGQSYITASLLPTSLGSATSPMVCGFSFFFFFVFLKFLLGVEQQGCGPSVQRLL
jgi:hypothetical protein